MLELDWVNGGQVTAGANHLPLTAAGHAPARKEEARGAVCAVPQGSKEVIPDREHPCKLLEQQISSTQLMEVVGQLDGCCGESL